MVNIRNTQQILGVFLATLLLPLAAYAVGTLDAEDSVAGLGISVTIHDLPQSESFELTLRSPTGGSERFHARTDAQGRAVVVIPGTSTEKSGTYLISVEQENATLTSQTVDVLPDSVDPWTSTIQTWTPRISADGRDEATITVTLRDQYGNALPGRPTTLISSRPQDAIRAVTPQTDDSGVQHFRFSTMLPGSAELRTIDLLSGNSIVNAATVQAGNTSVGGQQDFSYASPYGASVINPGGAARYYYAQTGAGFDVIDHFEVEAPTTMQQNIEASKITVRAVDRSGNIVENYVGTVLFSSTDPEAILPNFGSYTFKERDLGEKTFALALKFKASGQQYFRVEDQNDARIVGEASIMVSGSSTDPTTSYSIEITSHQDGDYVNSTDIVVEGRGPRFSNLIVMGGPQDATGASDETGFFSIPVFLSPNQRDFTVRVRDESGRNDSGPLHLILDQTPPVIEEVVFVPEVPEAGQKILVAVESEVGLAQVILRLPDSASGLVDEIDLVENPTDPGSYQAFFTAPDAGTYQPSILAMDAAGNVTELRTMFSVGLKSLPRVENLEAQSRVEAVELSWDPVEFDVTSYRIYIGDSPTNFLYTLDTERAITKAVVRGLIPGEIYYFAVTALKSGQESTEKSDIVQAQVLGLTLDVEPEDSALHVKWTSLSTDVPLSTFTLEYGIDQENLTEMRTLNGELRDYTIRDLLNGVLYYIKLTPITVTGDTLEELAATGQGTPNGDGLHLSARDDIPGGVGIHPGDTLHPADETPSTGIPPLAWFVIIGFAALGVLWRVQHRRSISQTKAFLQAIEAQYHR